MYKLIIDVLDGMVACAWIEKVDANLETGCLELHTVAGEVLSLKLVVPGKEDE